MGGVARERGLRPLAGRERNPSWRTVVWDASELAAAVVWTGASVPDSFWVYGTPDATAPGEATAA